MNVDHSFIFMVRDKRIKDVNGDELMMFIGCVDNLSFKFNILNNFENVIFIFLIITFIIIINNQKRGFNKVFILLYFLLFIVGIRIIL